MQRLPQNQGSLFYLNKKRKKQRNGFHIKNAKGMLVKGIITIKQQFQLNLKNSSTL